MKRKYEIAYKGKKFEVEVEEVTSPEQQRTSAQINKPFIPPPPIAPKRESAPKVEAPKQSVSSADKTVTAPMSGTVLTIEVKIGDEVKTGDLLLKLEAMKMETAINATSAGKISQIYCSKSQNVTAGEPLIGLE